jgi:hypothetical protein
MLNVNKIGKLALAAGVVGAVALPAAQASAMDRRGEHAIVGGLLGATAGALIGGDATGALVGAGAGALLGAATTRDHYRGYGYRDYGYRGYGYRGGYSGYRDAYRYHGGYSYRPYGYRY